MSNSPQDRDDAFLSRELRHDLRTPVNHILSFARLAREDAEDAGQSALVRELHAIEADGERTLALLATMAACKRHERAAVEAHATSIRALMRGIAERLALVSPTDPSTQSDLERIGLSAGRLGAMLDDLLTPTGESDGAPIADGEEPSLSL